jgi:hypothetical protein
MVCGSPLFFCEIGHGDRAAAARFVDDLHALRDQLFFLQHFGDRARQQIRAAAGAGVNNRLYLSARFEFLTPGKIAEYRPDGSDNHRQKHRLIFHLSFLPHSFKNALL